VPARTLVDPVGGGDDAALGRLPEHLGEANDGHGTGLNDVGEHLPRPDRGQLVDIAHDQHGGLFGGHRRLGLARHVPRAAVPGQHPGASAGGPGVLGAKRWVTTRAPGSRPTTTPVGISLAPTTRPVRSPSATGALGPSAGSWGNCPPGGPGHRLPIVALMPQWGQDYPNKRPPSRATAISEMGHKPPLALQNIPAATRLCRRPGG
jgi:hypothetical protein